MNVGLYIRCYFVECFKRYGTVVGPFTSCAHHIRNYTGRDQTDNGSLSCSRPYPTQAIVRRYSLTTTASLLGQIYVRQ
jgi:hypothetical protein